MQRLLPSIPPKSAIFVSGTQSVPLDDTSRRMGTIASHDAGPMIVYEKLWASIVLVALKFDSSCSAHMTPMRALCPLLGMCAGGHYQQATVQTSLADGLNQKGRSLGGTAASSYKNTGTAQKVNL